jgi:hypothetical protein
MIWPILITLLAFAGAGWYQLVKFPKYASIPAGLVLIIVWLCAAWGSSIAWLVWALFK